MYTCPECGERSVKKRVEKPGWYFLHCEKCGADMGPFRDVEDKGVA